MAHHQILIVGGGQDAELFLRSLDGASHYYPVGVLDDDGRTAQLRGVPILGAVADAETVIAKSGVESLLVDITPQIDAYFEGPDAGATETESVEDTIDAGIAEMEREGRK